LVTDRIYLIGMPGSGKTTLGKQLAKYLGWAYIDLDVLVEEMAGNSITNIFANNGELYFRNLEQAALHKTFIINRVIIACGGGTIAFEDNMEQINLHGASLYLNASNNFLLSRIKASKMPRPMFLGLSEEVVLSKIIELRAKREVFFSLANAQVDIPHEGVKALLKKVSKLFNLDPK